MITPRRNFLQWLGAGSVLAATGLPLGSAAAQSPAPVSDKWDMSWCDRVNGKVRAVFDSPEISEGAAMFRAQLWRNQYHDVYGTPSEEQSAVVVFRHEGIPLVMNDEYWQRFNVGKEAKLRTPEGKKWATVNPIAMMRPGTPAAYATFNIASFIASGGVVLACNLAFASMVSQFRTADKLSAEDARKRAIEHLVPGVILQPSGVFAVLRAQQAGCSFIIGS